MMSDLARPRSTVGASSATARHPRVVFIGDGHSPECGQWELGCRFYGFEFSAVTAPKSERALGPGSAPLLVVWDATALRSGPARDSARALATQYRGAMTLTGCHDPADEETAAAFLGTMVQLRRDAGASALWVCADAPTDAGFALRTTRLPLATEAAAVIRSAPGANLRPVAVAGATRERAQPVALQAGTAANARYVVSRITPAEGAWTFRRSHFAEIAPVFVILREVGGRRCWLPPANLANLTIDDPWLIEPYGQLGFAALVAEMQRERFHATIGFVPWNYDRSRRTAIELFRRHPRELSISVHGNNHDRYEFYRYESKPGDTQRAKPLAEQEFAVAQAMARMRRFEAETGLPFDRVMVFPHGVSPADTFKALRTCGYWATVNFSNVPLGETAPADPLFYLRPVTTHWHNFPALRRVYPRDYAPDSIAIDLFLGNPVLFMAHQDLFFGGIDAFTPHAAVVNRLQPATRWVGLGELSRHLHLMRWLEETRCEVLLTSRHATIENPLERHAHFHFTKEETGSDVRGVTVDGRSVGFDVADGRLQFDVEVAAGATVEVAITYAFDAAPASVPIRRSGLRNRALRFVSDLRDVTLSRTFVGRIVSDRYYPAEQRRLFSPRKAP